MNTEIKNLPLLKDLATVLKFRVDADPVKLEKAVQTRLALLGLGKTCGRCGGTGEHSFCQAYGKTCFKCGGSGQVVQTLTVKLLEGAKEKAADGTLAAHLAGIANRKAAKLLRDEVFTAWGKLPNHVNVHFTHGTESDIGVIIGKHATACSKAYDKYGKVSPNADSRDNAVVANIVKVGREVIAELNQITAACKAELETLLAIPVADADKARAEAIVAEFKAKQDAYLAANKHCCNAYFILSQMLEAENNLVVGRLVLATVFKATVNLEGK